ncbi:putative protein OS=Streptomyces griseomycini OX=66895 GN=FHS37_001469 PE=4 SV=1 [Streptomyces griseomycini]|uniref:Uncharacterized protein n=1 Tax=Streptomyces griseomycini TaxID=66895 RepID=A0A7W7LWM5_9ACTN|nr:hypothetical protein [Streptomyces griseomycini]
MRSSTGSGPPRERTRRAGTAVRGRSPRGRRPRSSTSAAPSGSSGRCRTRPSPGRRGPGRSRRGGLSRPPSAVRWPVSGRRAPSPRGAAGPASRRSARAAPGPRRAGEAVSGADREPSAFSRTSTVAPSGAGCPCRWAGTSGRPPGGSAGSPVRRAAWTLPKAPVAIGSRTSHTPTRYPSGTGTAYAPVTGPPTGRRCGVHRRRPGAGHGVPRPPWPAEARRWCWTRRVSPLLRRLPVRRTRATHQGRVSLVRVRHGPAG